MWPSKKQWSGWSLPSKLTAIGTYTGILSFIFALFIFINSSNNKQKSTQTQTIHNQYPNILNGKFLNNVRWKRYDSAVNISADIDLDGFDETITIQEEYPLGSGARLGYINGETNSLVDYLAGIDKEELFVHIAIKDITNDGQPEILLAYTNPKEVFLAALRIYQYEGLKREIRGQELATFKTIFNDDILSDHCEIQEGGYIRFPYGSKGLADTKKWNGNSFETVDNFL